MANAEITLTNDQGTLVPSQPSVPVNSGDTVSFCTSDGSTAYLFFSPAAAAALSPAPASPVQVNASPVAFEFLSSNPGAYSVFFETDSNATVPAFPVVPSSSLLLSVDLAGVSFGNVNNRIRD